MASELQLPEIPDVAPALVAQTVRDAYGLGLFLAQTIRHDGELELADATFNLGCARSHPAALCRGVLFSPRGVPPLIEAGQPLYFHELYNRRREAIDGTTLLGTPVTELYAIPAAKMMDILLNDDVPLDELPVRTLSKQVALVAWGYLREWARLDDTGPEPVFGSLLSHVAYSPPPGLPLAALRETALVLLVNLLLGVWQALCRRRAAEELAPESPRLAGEFESSPIWAESFLMFVDHWVPWLLAFVARVNASCDARQPTPERQ